VPEPALTSFQNAPAIEKIHHGLYGEAPAAIKEGKDLPAATICLCQVGGNTVIGDSPETCGVCAAGELERPDDELPAPPGHGQNMPPCPPGCKGPPGTAGEALAESPARGHDGR
jgi:hypothetical protein